MYTSHCCGMIAVKREVAARLKGTAGFPWSECQKADSENQLQETDGKSLYKHMSVSGQKQRADASTFEAGRKSFHICVKEHDTHGRVYSHRLSYLLSKSAKRRRLFLWQVK